MQVKSVMAAIAVFMLVVALAHPAEAKRLHQNQQSVTASDTVTVDTAAGIPITVSRDFAPKIVAFIASNIAAGKKFKSIRCLNFASTHVAGSAHFTGDACDFKPRPIGRLAGDFGLRNGCSFMVGKPGHRHPDCMHIDNRLAIARR